MKQHLCRPYFPFLFFVLRDTCIECRVLFHQFPFHSLPKAVSKQLMNITDGRCADKIAFSLPGDRVLDRLRFQQLLIVFFQNPRRNVLQFHVPDKRNDVVVDGAKIRTVG